MDSSRWRTPANLRRAVDAVAVLGCLFLTVLAVKGHWSPLPPWVIAAAGGAGSLTQWPRRRFPHAAAAAGAAAFALSGNPGPWLVGLYSGAVYAPRRQLWLPGAAGWAGFVAWSWLDSGRPTVDGVVYGALAAGLALAVGSYLATRNALLAALRERAEHAEAERVLREEQARAAERGRIAREMHDVLAHKVSLIALYAGALELHAGADARLREGTALIRATAREALRELREVLGVLRAEPGAEPFADLASLVRASTQAGQRVVLHDNAGTLPTVTARVVYRIVQEGLTNARKHAPGAGTTVTVERAEPDSVTVTVHNGLAGDAPAELPGSRSGLIGLTERIRLVGGSLRSGPAIRDGVPGWELHAVVPLVGQHAGEPAGVEAT
jgi:signal transduction histidine kinase